MNKDAGGGINILQGGHKAHGGPPQFPHLGKPSDGELAIS